MTGNGFLACIVYANSTKLNIDSICKGVINSLLVKEGLHVEVLPFNKLPHQVDQNLNYLWPVDEQEYMGVVLKVLPKPTTVIYLDEEQIPKKRINLLMETTNVWRTVNVLRAPDILIVRMIHYNLEGFSPIKRKQATEKLILERSPRM